MTLKLKQASFQPSKRGDVLVTVTDGRGVTEGKIKDVIFEIHPDEVQQLIDLLETTVAEAEWDAPPADLPGKPPGKPGFGPKVTPGQG